MIAKQLSGELNVREITVKVKEKKTVKTESLAFSSMFSPHFKKRQRLENDTLWVWFTWER